MRWTDKYGLLHLEPNPEPEQSENGPMYTGLFYALKYETKTLTIDEAYNFLASVSWLYNYDDKTWRTTPVTELENTRFSRDNFTGVVCGTLCVRRLAYDYSNSDLIEQCNAMLKMVPLFHKQLDHPRDFVLVGLAKYGLLFSLLTPFLVLPLLLTCAQRYKVRGSKKDGSYRKIVKTDGKLLTWLTCTAFGWYGLRDFCLGLIRGGRIFNSWHGVSLYYFRNREHPINSLFYKISRKN